MFPWENQQNWQVFSQTDQGKEKGLKLSKRETKETFTKLTEMKRIIKEYYKQLYANKTDKWNGQITRQTQNTKLIYEETKNISKEIISNRRRGQAGIRLELNWKSREFPSCREPAQEIPPMAKVMRKSPDGQRRVRTRGTPWPHPWQGHAGEADQDSQSPLDLLEHLSPKPKSVCYTTLFWH